MVDPNIQISKRFVIVSRLSALKVSIASYSITFKALKMQWKLRKIFKLDQIHTMQLLGKTLALLEMKKDFCELPWNKRTRTKECILISLIRRIFQAQSSLKTEIIQIIRHLQHLVVLKSWAATLKTRNESKHCSLCKTKDQLSKWIKSAGCRMVKWLTALWGTC